MLDGRPRCEQDGVGTTSRLPRQGIRGGGARAVGHDVVDDPAGFGETGGEIALHTLGAGQSV